MSPIGDPHMNGPCWCGSDHRQQDFDTYRAMWSPMTRREVVADIRARFRAEAPWLINDPKKIRRVIFRLLDEVEG